VVADVEVLAGGVVADVEVLAGGVVVVVVAGGVVVVVVAGGVVAVPATVIVYVVELAMPEAVPPWSAFTV
jgi:hypothetical protein